MFVYDYKSPFWSYYDIQLPNPLKYVYYTVNDIGPVSKPEKQYRYLKEGERFKEGDEWGCADHKTSPVSSNIWNYPVSAADERMDDVRREVRMQDAEHRYLDAGEKIVEEDEFLSHIHDDEWKKSGEYGRYQGTVGDRFTKDYVYRRKWPTFKNTEVTVDGQKVNCFDNITHKELPNPEYRFLKAGEVTQEGDEVEVGSPWNSLQWEKVRNGNLNLCIGKYQETQKSYRRKVEAQKVKETTIDPGEGFRILKEGEVVQKGDEVTLYGNSWSLVGISIGTIVGQTNTGIFRREKTLVELAHDVWPRTNARLEELRNEVKTLKDQLANAMAEVNELKAKIEPMYIYLKVGDLIKDGDEVCYEDWSPTVCQGLKVGQPGTFNSVDNRPFEYRRRVK
jgi:hypothetical protein